MKTPSLRRLLKLGQLYRVKSWRRAVLKGCAAAIEHKSLIEGTSIGTLLDVGANVGQFSVLARELSPKTRIHAFEPQKNAAAVFSDIFSADDLTTLHKCAIGNEAGAHDMHISQSADSSSLLAISERQNEVFPGTSEVGTESIEVDQLSARIDINSLPSPVFMKVDVQGFELEVLKGCTDVLQHIDTIYIECSFQELYVGQALADEVIQLLFKHNFSLGGIYNPSYDKDGLCVQADMLFRKAGTNSK